MLSAFTGIVATRDTSLWQVVKVFGAADDVDIHNSYSVHWKQALQLFTGIGD